MARRPPTIDSLVDYSWRSGILEWKLDDLQLKISRSINASDAKKVCILSSRQIGKSYFSCVFALEYLLKNPNTIARIIAPTIEQGHNIVQDNLSKILEDAPPGLITRQKSELRWDLSNGSSLRIGGLKRAHVDSNRGGNASLVIFEECGFVCADDFTYGVDSVLAPQLLRSAGREIFVSTPSEDHNHPLHTKVVNECLSSNSFFRFTVFDSPSISKKMIEEAIRRSGGEDTESFRREYLAEIIRSPSLMVIPHFDDIHHVKPFTLPHFAKYIISIDWGGVRDLTVALIMGYDFTSDLDVIVDELTWPPNTPTFKIVDEINVLKKKYLITIDDIYADVPGQLQVDLNSTFDFPIIVPPKSDWSSAVNKMAVKFSMRKILIHPRCEFLIKTCRSAMFNKSKLNFERSAELGHCDALAALMYGIRVINRENQFNNNNPVNNNNVIYINNKDENNKDVGDFGSMGSKVIKFKAFGKFKDNKS